ncbi:MAG: multidrug ABC transporter substrate-binding protein [Planctomycetota bacterium]|nr:MAG: multidrug ABC transporter substrate-binding protein [Planctomycetota bacterium]
MREVAPVVSGFAHLKYRDRDTRASVLGTTVTYLPVRAFEVERGRAFTEIEVESGAPVVLLGPDTARELFGEQDPLGQTVRIEQVACQVIGVLEPKGDQGWYNPDQQTLVPYPVAMRQLFGQRTLREIGIRMEDGADLQHAEAQVAALLRRRHQRRPGAGDDFRIRNQAELLDTYSSVSRTFTLLLGGIASISLLVGGIGIMNIMLVTVTERTREIGIRKAIGARERDILRQFLIEAVLMSGLGGLFGLLAGLGASWAFDRFSGFEIVLEPGAVALALGFAAAVGIFFGYYPARRAAALDPIEALRYE